jgi:hypothetical protein
MKDTRRTASRDSSHVRAYWSADSAVKQWTRELATAIAESTNHDP